MSTGGSSKRVFDGALQASLYSRSAESKVMADAMFIEFSAPPSTSSSTHSAWSAFQPRLPLGSSCRLFRLGHRLAFRRFFDFLPPTSSFLTANSSLFPPALSFPPHPTAHAPLPAPLSPALPRHLPHPYH